MKKFLLALISMMLLLSLTACNTAKPSTKPSTNLISETKITDREKFFLSIENDKYLIFDFNADSKYKWLKVWVDKYEMGKKILSCGELSVGLPKGEKGMIIITVNDFEKMKQNWTLAVKSGNATSKIELNLEDKTVENHPLSKIFGTNNSKAIAINDNEIVLANICYQDQSKNGSMGSLTDEFYSNPGKNIKEIENYSLVYLLKFKSYENKPA
ncbi:MAG: hypothetical protein QME45_10210 [Clostridiales bacterium]|nr:hypothetical protein [Clostridiales bacterium]